MLGQKKLNISFSGTAAFQLSHAAFVILLSELKKNMPILPHH